MENLSVSLDHLRDLEKRQTDAAGMIKTGGESGTNPEGFNSKLRSSHGAVCAPAFSPAGAAETARAAATEALVKVSEQLAQRVLLAADDYQNTNTNEAGKLNNQMPSS
jgi:hypothetical protein